MRNNDIIIINKINELAEKVAEEKNLTDKEWQALDDNLSDEEFNKEYDAIYKKHYDFITPTVVEIIKLVDEIEDIHEAKMKLAELMVGKVIFPVDVNRHSIKYADK